jgi:hypothetical protein
VELPKAAANESPARRVRAERRLTSRASSRRCSRVPKVFAKKSTPEAPRPSFSSKVSRRCATPL